MEEEAKREYEIDETAKWKEEQFLQDWLKEKPAPKASKPVQANEKMNNRQQRKFISKRVSVNEETGEENTVLVGRNNRSVVARTEMKKHLNEKVIP